MGLDWSGQHDPLWQHLPAAQQAARPNGKIEEEYPYAAATTPLTCGSSMRRNDADLIALMVGQGAAGIAA